MSLFFLGVDYRPQKSREFIQNNNSFEKLDCHSTDKTGWLVGWLVGWMVGWLVGWLVVLRINTSILHQHVAQGQGP